jgi:hypothetical protein
MNYRISWQSAKYVHSVVYLEFPNKLGNTLYDAHEGSVQENGI